MLKILLPFLPNLNRGHTSEEVIFAVSFVTVFSLLLIPSEKISGNPVPILVFHGRASCFHTFVLALNFAFCGAVMTIFLRHMYPTLAGYTRLLASLSMIVAVGVVASLLVVNIITE